MLRFSANERRFTREGVEANVRGDGRQCDDFRSVGVARGFLPQANGSARVTLTVCDEGTEVVAAVKVEIVNVAQLEASGKLRNNIRSLPGASNRSSSGSSDGDSGVGGISIGVEPIQVSATLPQTMGGSKDFKAGMEATIAAMVQSGLLASAGQSLAKLTIVPNRFQWVVYVDISVLQYSGNVIDAAVLAASIAVQDATIPRLDVYEVTGNTMDFEVEQEMPPQPLSNLLGVEMPVCATVHKIGDSYLLDANLTEEACSEASLAVTACRDGYICHTSTLAGASIPKQSLLRMLQAGSTKCVFLHKILAKALGNDDADADADAAPAKSQPSDEK